MIRYHKDANYHSAASPIYALNRHFCGRGRIRTCCVSYVPDLQSGAHPPSEQLSHYLVWIARFERALAITACSGSQNRRGWPTPPYPDYKFPDLSMTLKSKRASSLLRKLFISYIISNFNYFPQNLFHHNPNIQKTYRKMIVHKGVNLRLNY